jgi:outer membrane protein OmpA-like peptidoglycan-associated protein
MNHVKRRIGVWGTLAIGLGIATAGCGADREPPKTLVDARTEVQRADDGFAKQFDPTDVHEADVALGRAEQAWRNSPGDPTADDLAVVADRRARIAIAEAGILRARQDSQKATEALSQLKAQQLKNAQNQLNSTQQTLGATEMQLQQQQANAAAQAQKLQELQESLKSARETISKIATVKESDQGMVISLPSEVLFKTDKFDLKPAALARLDQIATALKGKDAPIVVYGYTDNTGTREHNLDLSEQRADAVRDYLISKGLPKDTVTAEGKGPDDPVADNGSIEGRAQNRRVEIVVKPKP